MKNIHIQEKMNTSNIYWALTLNRERNVWMSSCVSWTPGLHYGREIRENATVCTTHVARLEFPRETGLILRGHGFDPWSGKIPHVTEQLSPHATTTELPSRAREPQLLSLRASTTEAHAPELVSAVKRSTARRSGYMATKSSLTGHN